MRGKKSAEKRVWRISNRSRGRFRGFRARKFRLRSRMRPPDDPRPAVRAEPGAAGNGFSALGAIAHGNAFLEFLRFSLFKRPAELLKAFARFLESFPRFAFSFHLRHSVASRNGVDNAQDKPHRAQACADHAFLHPGDNQPGYRQRNADNRHEASDQAQDSENDWNQRDCSVLLRACQMLFSRSAGPCRHCTIRLGFRPLQFMSAMGTRSRSDRNGMAAVFATSVSNRNSGGKRGDWRRNVRRPGIRSGGRRRGRLLAFDRFVPGPVRQSRSAVGAEQVALFGGFSAVGTELRRLLSRSRSLVVGTIRCLEDGRPAH